MVAGPLGCGSLLQNLLVCMRGKLAARACTAGEEEVLKRQVWSVQADCWPPVYSHVLGAASGHRQASLLLFPVRPSRVRVLCFLARPAGQGAAGIAACWHSWPLLLLA